MANSFSTFLQDISFAEVLLVLVIGWMLVGLWSRVVDNIAFELLKLDKNFWFHTLIIALVATVIFLSFIFVFQDIFGSGIRKDAVGTFIGQDKDFMSNILNEL
jgi:hypothetical protein